MAASGTDPVPMTPSTFTHIVVLPQPSPARLCATCHRPPRALDPSEYTRERAALVIERGLCLCP